MKKRMQKVNLLSELERLTMQLRAAAAVITYGVQGGDLTKPIPIGVLNAQPVHRLYGEDMITDGDIAENLVHYKLRPVPAVAGGGARAGVEVTVVDGRLVDTAKAGGGARAGVEVTVVDGRLVDAAKAGAMTVDDQ